MKLVVVFSGTLFQAEMVKALLENDGIPAFLKDQYTGTRSPVWSPPGGVKVTVPDDCLEDSKRIVEEYERKLKG